MRDALVRRNGPFYQPDMLPRVQHNWPHHCLPQRISWRVPSTMARLNHYATRHEQRWREKCLEENPTFAGNSRNHSSMCDVSESQGMLHFFRRLNNDTDLRLFEQLDRFRAIPDLFLTRAWPPALEHRVARHCRANSATLQGAAITLCAEVLQLKPEQSTLRGREPNPRPSCDCQHLDNAREWMPRYRCTNHGGRDDDGTYCWLLCCRGDDFPALRLRNISWTKKEAWQHGRG